MPAAPRKAGTGFSLLNYLRGVRAELKRITWPTPRATIMTTVAVLVMVSITCLFFLVVDQAIGLGIRFLFGIGG
ncbi:preprotein translocase subunit SecE [Oecophyllibacter saccharovorans]|uniref:Protein translocase subunit SecE n=1 Tax=Oecophyllibacter saccharovorans TaxID=2558360 RepID=A0A506UMR7_9PROT|nr:preprotein translocase subunit SecE [Oecophyllibacter saccharovorans]QDH16026.1 preprotein translocase subunit SecE [Oecophyllibacter saccharovorans]TPW34542.1 preprotein translocase subunit SecE [Oecophyllibacter saccharovorans]TPW36271.1 preprotein translocase subunit SecE [Oecophyllibacter saccharovorans]